MVTASSSVVPSTAAVRSNRWVQLVVGIVGMVAIANLQYGWTLFVNPIDVKFHFGKAAIQVAFSLFVLLMGKLKVTVNDSRRCVMIRAFRRSALILAIVLLVAGCQALTGETIGQNIDDTNITASVKAKLVADKALNLTRVGVKTYQSTVYLTGIVDSPEHSARVEQLTKDVGGVKGVVNNLQVQKP